jgi:lipoate-protein ligase A
MTSKQFIELWNSIEANYKEKNINIFDAKIKSLELVKQRLEISDEEIDNAVVLQYENVGDEKLFPNHSDKDIWMNGFYEGAKWYREQIKNK